jgi:hypothetical protein
MRARVVTIARVCQTSDLMPLTGWALVGRRQVRGLGGAQKARARVEARVREARARVVQDMRDDAAARGGWVG